MSELHNVNQLDDTASDEQLQALEQTLRDILDVEETYHAVLREAEDKAYELLQAYVSDGVETINNRLHDYVYDLYCRRVDVVQNHGIIPHTDGHAHDVVHEVTHELADQMMDDIAITEEDIHIYEQSIETEPEPDRVYEQQLDI